MEIRSVPFTSTESGFSTTVSDEEKSAEKSVSKVTHTQGHLRVLIDDITYLMIRTEGKTLTSIDEHYQLIEEIHDAQRILASFEAYTQIRIAEIAAQKAITDMLHSIRLQAGIVGK